MFDQLLFKSFDTKLFLLKPLKCNSRPIYMIWLITPTGYWELHIKYILLLTYMFIKCNMYKWFFMFKNKAVNVFPCWLLFCKLWKVKIQISNSSFTLVVLIVIPSDTVYFIIFTKNLFLTTCKLESNFPFFLHTVHKL